METTTTIHGDNTTKAIADKNNNNNNNKYNDDQKATTTTLFLLNTSATPPTKSTTCTKCHDDTKSPANNNKNLVFGDHDDDDDHWDTVTLKKKRKRSNVAIDNLMLSSINISATNTNNNKTGVTQQEVIHRDDDDNNTSNNHPGYANKPMLSLLSTSSWSNEEKSNDETCLIKPSFLQQQPQEDEEEDHPVVVVVAATSTVDGDYFRQPRYPISKRTVCFEWDHHPGTIRYLEIVADFCNTNKHGYFPEWNDSISHRIVDELAKECDAVFLHFRDDNHQPCTDIRHGLWVRATDEEILHMNQCYFLQFRAQQQQQHKQKPEMVVELTNALAKGVFFEPSVMSSCRRPSKTKNVYPLSSCSETLTSSNNNDSSEKTETNYDDDDDEENYNDEWDESFMSRPILDGMHIVCASSVNKCSDDVSSCLTGDQLEENDEKKETNRDEHVLDKIDKCYIDTYSCPLPCIQDLATTEHLLEKKPTHIVFDKPDCYSHTLQNISLKATPIVGDVQWSHDPAVDVVFGKGRPTEQNGNVIYREYVNSVAHRYIQTPTTKVRQNLAWEIVGFVYERGGNFVKRNHDGRWVVVKGKEALKKTEQRLMDIKKRVNRLLKEARTSGLVDDVLNVVAWLNADMIDHRMLPLASESAMDILCSLRIMQKCSAGQKQDEPLCFSIPPVFQAAVRTESRSPAAAISAIQMNGMDAFSQCDVDTWDAAVVMMPHVDSLREFVQSLEGMEEEDKLALAELFIASGHVGRSVLCDYEAARKNYVAARDILIEVYDEKGDPNNLRIALTLTHIGRLYQHWSKYSCAIGMYTQALSMLRANNGDASSLTIAKLLHDLGRAHFCLGKTAESLDFFQTAVRMKQQERASPKSIVISLANIAQLYFISGRYNEALDVYQEVRRIHGLGYRTVFGATTCLNEGHVHQALGDFRKAKDKYELALEIYEQVFGCLAKNESIGIAHIYLGSVLIDIGDMKSSSRHLNEALNCISGDKGNNEHIANITVLFGRLHEIRGEKEAAVAKYVEGKHILHEA